MRFVDRSKPGRVTVPGKLSDDLAPGTLNSILEQAGLKQRWTPCATACPFPNRRAASTTSKSLP